MATWNERETGLVNAKENIGCCPAVAHLPEVLGSYVGQASLDDATRQKIYSEGARTIPGREHGGNCDIKNLSRGSKCYFPVFIPGANLSVGDLHFSQGDGELSFCGAIEMVRFCDIIACRLSPLALYALICGILKGWSYHVQVFRHQRWNQEVWSQATHL